MTEAIDCDLTEDDNVNDALKLVAAHGGQRVSSVVHLAAYYDFSGEPSDLYDKVTVAGTRRLLAGLQRLGFLVEQFLFSSTMLVHAPVEPGQRINEDSPLQATWPYPQSKVRTEAVLREERGFGLPIPAGDVLEGDLWNLLPLDTPLKMGWVTGAELRKYLEDELELVYSSDAWKRSGGWGPRVSGLMMTYVAMAPFGKRLRSVRVGGKEVKGDVRYTMAGCEREGEPLDVVCRHPGTHDVKVLSFTIHRTLLAYCEKHRVLSPRREGRAVAVDLPGEVFSQDEVLARRT